MAEEKTYRVNKHIVKLKKRFKMAKKRNLTAHLCYAQWCCKNVYELKEKFIETCKGLGIRYEIIDVDTEEGAEYSVKNNFRNVPIIIVYENDKEIARYKGNLCFINLINL